MDIWPVAARSVGVSGPRLAVYKPVPAPAEGQGVSSHSAKKRVHPIKPSPPPLFVFFWLLCSGCYLFCLFYVF